MASQGGPDFLCIGAQKAGTTWLHLNLKRHPECWLPPFKELSYFNIPRASPIRSLISRRYPFRMARLQLAGAVASRLRGHKPAELAWLARFVLLPRGDRWYRSLFRDTGDRISGEATPQYAAMPEARIRHARRMYPDARIVYVLRDPIARSWSSVKHHATWGLGKSVGDFTPAELYRMAFFPHIVKHSSYLDNLDRWRRVFPEEQILVTFFEDLVADPRSFLARILEFLGSPTRARDLPAAVDELRDLVAFAYGRLAYIQDADSQRRLDRVREVLEKIQVRGKPP